MIIISTLVIHHQYHMNVHYGQHLYTVQYHMVQNISVLQKMKIIQQCINNQNFVIYYHQFHYLINLIKSIYQVMQQDDV
ncbi:hypothetical protein Smp_141420 [Schistosoma mansoni]|uniref:hypothetical protein n=1 Tax=Schistosoma mansoni TaxID=6183 RepID=UPI00022DC9F7|nr:hypothetical protein Smp_141420 [Schistosoma mansoni]|eukprot:XP_018655668.1 hypothetical protein Smp_141420 [Schistosoma mansoni]